MWFKLQGPQAPLWLHTWYERPYLQGAEHQLSHGFSQHARGYSVRSVGRGEMFTFICHPVGDTANFVPDTESMLNLESWLHPCSSHPACLEFYHGTPRLPLDPAPLCGGTLG